MRERVASVMNRFGTDMTLSNPEGTATVRGFFWAVNSKSWQSMESEATLLGEIFRGQYVYLGPADVEIREGDTLSLGDKTYVLRRAEIFYYGNEPLYRWALCVEKGVNDTWGTQS